MSRVLLAVAMFTAVSCQLGCPNKEEPKPPAQLTCIQVPPSVTGQTKERFVKAGVQLEKLKIGGNIESNFGQTVSTQFQTLSDDNVALYLLLNAVDCYRQPPNPLPQTSIDQMVETVKSTYAQRKKIAGTTANLSPLERKFINENQQLAPDILKMYQQLGVQ